MARWVDLDNPQIIKEGRDKFGNVLYAIPPDTQTADVRPVKRGEWLREDSASNYLAFKCSVCGTGGRLYKFPFCSKCGADMRGGDADGDTKD